MKFILYMFLSFLLISCKNKPEHPVKLIKMKPLASYPAIRLKSEQISLSDSLLNPTKISVQDTLLTIFEKQVDNSETFLKFYSLKSGKMIHCYGQVGRGPGEYSTPTVHWESPEKILITEKMRYTVFSLDSLFYNPSYMPFKKNVRIGLSAANDVYRLNDSIFLENSTMSDYQFSLYNIKSNKYLINYKNYPNLIKDGRMTDFIANSNVYHASFALKMDNKDSIVIAYELFPMIDFVSLNNFGSTRILFPFDKHVNVVTVMDNLNAMVENRKLYYTQSYSTNKYIYLMYDCKRPQSKEYASPEIHLFDWNGNFIKRYQTDQYISNFCVDEDSNIIYGIGSDTDYNPILLKFSNNNV